MIHTPANVRAEMIAAVERAEARRNFAKSPASWEAAAVRACFEAIKRRFHPQDIGRRARAGSARTFAELRAAIGEVGEVAAA